MNLSIPSRNLRNRAEDEHDEFLADVLAGLQSSPKTLPCKYFYDQRGSQLFDQICQLDEYYLSRTELAIMEAYAGEMGAQIGPGVRLVEFGSGSSIKTRILLDHLPGPAVYVPVDISLEHLRKTAIGLDSDYPEIEVLPVCADFTQPFQLPRGEQSFSHTAVYFPGSTIGNFVPQQAQQLLRQIAQLADHGGGLLIGIDLQKDPPKIEAAYNDALGVTAEFNLNLLRHINRELHANFRLDQFGHRADYNRQQGRVEIYLESRRRQTVAIGDVSISFAQGERICTEYSHKYTIDGFAAMASQAGLRLRKAWTDARRWFAVLHLVTMDKGGNA